MSTRERQNMGCNWQVKGLICLLKAGQCHGCLLGGSIGELALFLETRTVWRGPGRDMVSVKQTRLWKLKRKNRSPSDAERLSSWLLVTVGVTALIDCYVVG